MGHFLTPRSRIQEVINTEQIYRLESEAPSINDNVQKAVLCPEYESFLFVRECCELFSWLGLLCYTELQKTVAFSWETLIVTKVLQK